LRVKRTVLGIVALLLLTVIFCDSVEVYVKPEGGVVWVGLITGGTGESDRYYLKGYEALTGDFHNEIEVTEYIDDPWQTFDFQINEKDDTVWLAVRSKLIKFTPTGEQEVIREFSNEIIECFDIDPNNDCCWVSLLYGGIVKLATDDLRIIEDNYDFIRPGELSANPNEGTCWVIDEITRHVVKLSSDCSVIEEYDGAIYPTDIAVDPTDGSCWILDYSAERLIKISTNGDELFSIDDISFYDYGANLKALCVNPNDGSCYISCGDDGEKVRKYSSSGALIGEAHFNRACDIDVNTYDDTVWILEIYWWELYQYSPNLDEQLFEINFWGIPYVIDVNDG